jgi:dihydroorotate dehydrogenase (fumarate)
VLDLSTTYLGLKLTNPLVASASPLAESVEQLRRLEEAGISAVVMHSLFEEEVIRQSHEQDLLLDRGGLVGAEAYSYLPALDDGPFAPAPYLRHLERACRALRVPVIGSLNGVSSGGWVSYAREIEAAGAAALELNVYYIATDPDLGGAELEQSYVQLVRDVRAAVRIPIAVKLSPFFTSLPNVGQALVEAGADGLVLFNRFYQPDLDIERRVVVPAVELSTSHDLRLPLRWIAILYRRIAADFALSGGVHSAADVLKAVMAGASAAMTTSALLRDGMGRVTEILRDLTLWMTERDYDAIEPLIGAMSQGLVAEPAALERARYIHALRSIRIGAPPPGRPRLP